MARFRWTRRGTLALLAGSLTAAPAAAQPVRTFVIGTGDPTGTYYPIGGLIAEVISAPPGGGPCRPDRICGVAGLVAVAQTSAGSVANLEALQAGRIDSAFCQADVALEAWQGEGPFTGADFSGLRVIASLYPEVAQLVVADGAPKPPRRLATGSALSGTSLTASVVLPAFDIAPEATEQLPLNPSDALAAMAAGATDGFLTIAGLPTAAVAEALAAGGTRLVEADPTKAWAVAAARRHWRLTKIPAPIYGLADRVGSLAVPALWVVRADLEADIVQRLAAALWAPAARRVLDDGHPAGRLVALETALTGLSVPLHEGAERFYRETGVLVGPYRPSTSDQG